MKIIKTNSINHLLLIRKLLFQNHNLWQNWLEQNLINFVNFNTLKFSPLGFARLKPSVTHIPLPHPCLNVGGPSDRETKFAVSTCTGGAGAVITQAPQFCSSNFVKDFSYEVKTDKLINIDQMHIPSCVQEILVIGKTWNKTAFLLIKGVIFANTTRLMVKHALIQSESK